VRSLALGSIVVVAVAMLATTTLLPALLHFVPPGREPVTRAIGRWADGVLRRPGLALAGALLLLAALALPALALETGDGALRQFPPGDPTRAGFEAAVSETGPGRGAPVKLLVRRADVDATVALLRADPEVVKTGVRTQTRDKQRILVVATPEHDGDSPEAKALVARLRERLPPGTLVGGNTAAQVDFNAAVRDALPAVLAWIVALTFVLLALSLRSLPLALGGVLTNLLSVAAAFGVLTATNVWTGPGYVDTITIPLVLAVVFGLSMDYAIFLLSRMRERWLVGGDAREAIRTGLVSSARTITGAALIMVAVFAAFVVTGVPVVQQVGLGAAAAIAVDATIVRLLLVPAAMALLGERAWWRPGAVRWPPRQGRTAPPRSPARSRASRR
jgi:RND superfamily putative drug exporter